MSVYGQWLVRNYEYCSNVIGEYDCYCSGTIKSGKIMSRCTEKRTKENLSVGDFLKYIDELKKKSTEDDDKYLGDIDSLPILAFTEDSYLASCFAYEHELGIVIHAQDKE